MSMEFNTIWHEGSGVEYNLDILSHRGKNGGFDRNPTWYVTCKARVCIIPRAREIFTMVGLYFVMWFYRAYGDESISPPMNDQSLREDIDFSTNEMSRILVEITIDILSWKMYEYG